MLVKILKKITLSNGSTLNIGDIVDASAWRNTKALVAAKYVQLIEDVQNESPVVEKKPRTKKATAKAE